eukprot:TRINITY_DN101802_c0_g1_i1.p3 TRINITY_DN101802_c0_g1~~TRINITY_DN101802_c0_g1_i1.p3  ORF type:complete len:101 (+),score=2.86 TRINITY_DN101802_c0_g1_i1:294-596(+)
MKICENIINIRRSQKTSNLQLKFFKHYQNTTTVCRFNVSASSWDDDNLKYNPNLSNLAMVQRRNAATLMYYNIQLFLNTQIKWKKKIVLSRIHGFYKLEI